jgi:hypothetical protein
MDQKTSSNPINLSFTIESGSLKKVVEHGRLEEFIDTLSTRAGAHIRAAIVAQMAKGGTGAVSVKVGFDDDNEFGNGPHPWPHNLGIYESAMRQVAVNKAITKATTIAKGTTTGGRG